MNFKAFNCACLSREHILQITSDPESQLIEFNFKVRTLADSQLYQSTVFGKLWWRIKQSLKILFIGEIILEDSWLVSTEDKGFKEFVNEYNTLISSTCGGSCNACTTGK